MREGLIYEYAEYLERVLSFAYANNYYLPALAKSIGKSSFFQSIEKSDYYKDPIISMDDLIQDIFPELVLRKNDDVPSYSQCFWAAESYIRIQYHSKLTFECIFLFLPIEKIYSLFNLYHEMDFTQIIEYFEREYQSKSVLSILMENRKVSAKELKDKTGISENMIYSLKTRRRDIQKVDTLSIYKVADFFGVRIPTIAEIKQ